MIFLGVEEIVIFFGTEKTIIFLGASDGNDDGTLARWGNGASCVSVDVEVSDVSDA